MLNYVVLFAGFYFIVVSFIVITRNTKSTVFIKVIPFFLGVVCILSAINNAGWIVVNF